MTPVSDEQQIRLADIISSLRQGWKVVGISTAVAVLIAIIYLRVADYLYTAELKVTPAQQSGIASTSRLGSLASLAGVNVAAGEAAPPFELYLEILKSREAATAISARQDLMHRIFEKEWNQRTGTWVERNQPLRIVVKGVATLLGVPVAKWQPPGPARVQEFVLERLRIHRDPKNPIATLTFNYPDPEIAGTVLTLLHEHANENLRRRTLHRTSDYIAYLSAKLASVSITEYRTALTEVLSEQEKRRMMAGSSAPFAAEPLGPVLVSTQPTQPKPSMVLSIALLFGAALGSALAWLFYGSATPKAGASES